MPTHLPLRDSGTVTTSITPCPGHRRIHVSSAGLESANATHEPLCYASDSHVRRWTAPEVRCISLRFQLVDTPESPEPTLASQHSQTILKTTQARHNSGEKLTTMHWTTHCLTLEAVWRFPAPKGQPRHSCYTLVAVKCKNKIESIGRH